MKIPLRVPCDGCLQEQLIFIDLNDGSFQRNCSCGDVYSGFFTNDVMVGYKILLRSKYELDREDFSLSIVFSAAAFECQLSRLHFKWRDISAIKMNKQVSDAELEAMLRKYGTIDVKIEEVCRLMDPRGFKAFVASSNELSETVQEGLPYLRLQELTKDFQQKLFWPRNRVLHLADTSFKKEDAVRCFNISVLGLKILEEMDRQKGMEPNTYDLIG